MSDQSINKRKATVKLDAETARRFEALLREGLVNSTAVDRNENFELKVGESKEVEIDAVTVARMTEVLRKVKEGQSPVGTIPLTPAQLAGLMKLVENGTTSTTSAKAVFETMWATGEDARTIVGREGLAQVSDEGAIEAAIAEVIAASPDQVATYRKGKTSTLGWFVGQVMRKTGGKANPQLVNALLKKALEG